MGGRVAVGQAFQRCWPDPDQAERARKRRISPAAVAPAESQTVYAGALSGDVWLTMNKGATWTSIAGPNAGPLPVRNVNDIVVDPLDPRIAYVGIRDSIRAGRAAGTCSGRLTPGRHGRT